MRHVTLFALSLLAAPAFAQDADPTTSTKPDTPAAGPVSPFTVSGGATLVSDYRFRGLSQTDKDFAVQGSLTLAHDSGLYASVWASSIDDYVAFGSDAEIDVIAGYKREIASGTTFDIGVLYYYYPGAETLVSVDTDFFEPYVSLAHTLGPATAKVTLNYAPKQSALAYLPSGRKEDGLYLGGDLSGSYAGLGLSAHLGRSFSRNYATGGQRYTDWSLGATYAFGPVTLGVSYVDTDADPIASLTGRNIAKGGVVVSLGASF